MVARGGILAAALLLCAATVDAKALLQLQVPVGYRVCPAWHCTSAVACTWLLSADVSQPVRQEQQQHQQQQQQQQQQE